MTEKHTVTLEDIENFADLSGDKFYAHMDEKSLEGTMFKGRVAHGYFILSRAFYQWICEHEMLCLR